MRTLLVPLLGGGLAACSMTPDAPEPSPITAPRVEIPDDAGEASGSVFDKERNMRLFEDRSARSRGDLITVVIEEEMAGDRSVDSEMSRSQEADQPAPEIGGEELELFERPFSFQQEGESSFEGGGTADQETNLTATITAVVVDTTPNGHLVIQGEKSVTVSQGQEQLRLSGIVRPDDVGANNEVSSDQVANMQVGYTGYEALSDSAQPGW
ncbi:MAG: flagellar basal body L-ring protein FlgH, partial [Halorhodospira sp.]